MPKLTITIPEGCPIYICIALKKKKKILCKKNLRIEWHWQLKLANNYNVHGIPIKETKEKKD